MTSQQVDRLTAHCTVFATFCEFKRVMRESGYCPTIHPRDPKHRKLTELVRAAGFKVFDGRKVS